MDAPKDVPRAEFAIERPADAVHLPALLDCVDAAASRTGLAPSDAADLHVAAEEICVNVIRHGYPSRPPGPIGVTAAAYADRVVVVISDEAPRFDPADAPAPDLTADWRQRRIGGLGWYLAGRLVDGMSHVSPPEGGNRVTLTKRRR